MPISESNDVSLLLSSLYSIAGAVNAYVERLSTCLVLTHTPIMAEGLMEETNAAYFEPVFSIREWQDPKAALIVSIAEPV